ncbi:hypothetical protein VTL71DRAFT_5133 [Oculimacula yallundae]|uniref:Uncharacterized protein n=1 Tax=Oculimacula yallundae TaxID=86028 RepID=A0ABR4C098_9HELO
MDFQPPFSRVHGDPPNSSNPSHTESIPENDQGPATALTRKSTNPFRKHEEVLSFDAPRVLSPEPYSHMGVRKNTPVRAVFDDLTTAHSSITSGTARSRQRTLSNNNSDPADEEDSIPMQHLDLSKKDHRSPVPRLPTPPLPAVLATARFARSQDYLTDGDERFAGQLADLAEPMQPSLQEPKQSVFASIKNALVSYSSPSQAPWPRDRQSSENDQDLRSPENQGSGQESEYVDELSHYHSNPGAFKFPPSTPGGIRTSDVRTSNRYPTSYHPYNVPATSPPIPMSTHPRKFPRLVTGATEFSLREGSTVGNIVQHYAGSEGLDGDGSDFDQRMGVNGSKARSKNLFKPQTLGYELASSPPLYEPPQHSGLQFRKQRQGGAPKRTYAQAPRLDFTRNRDVPDPVDSSEMEPWPSSNINDQYRSSKADNVPRTPHPRGARDQDGNEVFDESISDTANSTLPSLPRISYRNPYRSNQARSLQARADPGHCIYDDSPNLEAGLGPQLPLEREVSQALRRASGYSVYSVGSVDSAGLDFGTIINYGKNTDLQAKTDGPSYGKGKGKEVAPGDQNNVGDGHVVDEQAKGFYDKDAIPTNWINSRQGIRVPINRLGSFPDSPPETPFGGNPQQSSRRRSTPADDVNDWETVGESAFGLEYGYDNPSGLIGGDVRRTGSSIANISDEGTASLHFEDINEFGSTERITQHPGTIQYSGDYRQRDLKSTKMPILMPVYNGHKVNGYLADSNRIRPSPVGAFFRPEPLTEAHKHPFNSTPPEVMPPARVAKAKGHRRSQLAPTDSRAASSSQNNTRRDRSSAYRKPSTAAESSRRVSEWTDSYRQTGPSESTQKHPFAEDDNNRPSSWQHVITFAKEMLDQEQSQASSRNGSGQAQPVPSSSRQPPGAFYQGLRAVSDHPRQHDGATKSAGRRSTAKPNGQFSLRPLSLLNGRLPSTPLRSVSNQSDMLDSDDFVYRSPLAPPKRNTWQKLYSSSRLLELQERAQADGVYSSQSTLSNANDVLSRRHLYEPPRLLPSPRKAKRDPTLEERKANFSKIVLTLCCFFPPLLILFAIGKMDGLMVWWSDGKCSRFCKSQKKWAVLILCIEVFVIAVLLITFLAWFFSKHRS